MDKTLKMSFMCVTQLSWKLRLEENPNLKLCSYSAPVRKVRLGTQGGDQILDGRREGLGMDAVGIRRKGTVSLSLSYGYTYFFFYEWVLL